MKNFNVVLKGSYLPAIGGVVIHISRLAEALFDDGLLDCVYSTTNSNGYVESRFILKKADYPCSRYTTFQSLLWFLNFNNKNKKKIIHIHGHPVWESPTILLLLFFRYKVVFTIHDQMQLTDFERYPRLLLYILKEIFKHKNIHWIAVNQIIKVQIENLMQDCKNLSVIPAYLPPYRDNAPLDNEIDSFFKLKSKVVTIYAHSIREFKGKDLYGIDLALKSIALVKNTYSDIGIIICIPNEPDSDQLDYYLQIINDSKLFNSVLFFLKPLKNPLLLWQKSDIVLRPTLTDGDSLVIREAISQGTYVIASDVVRRPENVILFKNEDINDLTSKIIETLGRPKLTEIEQPPSNYELIKNIYSSL